MAVFRIIHAEIVKTKHSFLVLIHLILPVLAVLIVTLYYKNTSYDMEFMASMYYTMNAAAFPVGISLMCAKSIGREEDNQFQWLLMNPNRIYAYAAKFIMLYLLGTVTTIICVLLFQYIGLHDVSFWYSAKLILAFLMTNFILYQIHIFLNLRFGKAVSILTGFCGSIVGLVMLTGIGNAAWQWIPYSIAGRLIGYFTLLEYGQNSMEQTFLYMSEITKAFLPLLIISIAVTVFMCLWFHRWEGRSISE